MRPYQHVSEIRRSDSLILRPIYPNPCGCLAVTACSDVQPVEFRDEERSSGARRGRHFSRGSVAGSITRERLNKSRPARHVKARSLGVCEYIVRIVTGVNRLQEAAVGLTKDRDPSRVPEHGEHRLRAIQDQRVIGIQRGSLPAGNLFPGFSIDYGNLTGTGHIDEDPCPIGILSKTFRMALELNVRDLL